ncbi:putative 39S ribosomal protein L50, mitochondrial [Apostichopus japonicus]|uniref:Large ribosomal subunit protein mL50 n=1 Tax=Stichopus japonicus TaxID=307972 RepID=A0A2G8K6R1_STIJA|nr:putative 39S ribosomal protein L50, mitochondrial [Apostichopus japonicus]
MIDDIRSEGERSWVNRFLRGSGPAAEVEEEEIVEIEPQYMDLLQEKRESFIEKPETRKRVYTPPEDLEDAILEITLKVFPELNSDNWMSQELKDVSTKYQILTECFQRFNHDVPNFLLDKMSTVKAVVDYYNKPVKDTTKFDELSMQDLPKNLKIHWEYEDDSQLEVYQEYLDYTRVKKTGPPSKYPFKKTLFY